MDWCCDIEENSTGKGEEWKAREENTGTQFHSSFSAKLKTWKKSNYSNNSQLLHHLLKRSLDLGREDHFQNSTNAQKIPQTQTRATSIKSKKKLKVCCTADPWQKRCIQTEAPILRKQPSHDKDMAKRGQWAETTWRYWQLTAVPDRRQKSHFSVCPFFYRLSSHIQ